MPESTLLLVVGLLFISFVRLTVDNFINAYGLFSDIWAPATEAALNLGLSVLFGTFYGLNGIITGVIISQVVIILPWNPYFLFTRGLTGFLARYWQTFTTRLIIGLLIALNSFWIVSRIPVDAASGLQSFLLIGAANLAIYTLTLFAVFLFFTSGMRAFLHRMIDI